MLKTQNGNLFFKDRKNTDHVFKLLYTGLFSHFYIKWFERNLEFTVVLKRDKLEDSFAQFKIC